jgi:phosphoribosylanthranilate isomerase
MLVKVCGITLKEQFDELTRMGVDMIGFNFYPKSKRFLSGFINAADSAESKTVGVFVNSTVAEVENIAVTRG